MIEITIKTLDSQNHVFSVEDHITVRELKDIIADSVKVSADSQRLIYFGRVLIDEKKLSEYDVNGKVIHLVQRAPPSTSRLRNSGTSESTSGQDGGGGGSSGMPAGRWTYMGRIGRPGETNATYLGAMAFPADLMESRGIAPRPPTRRLTPYRMSVAESMLHIADRCLVNLENASSRSRSDQPTQTEAGAEGVRPAGPLRGAAASSKESGAPVENLPGSSSPTDGIPASSGSTSDMSDLASSSQLTDVESMGRSDVASKADSTDGTKTVDNGRASTASADESSSSNDSKTSLPSTSNAPRPQTAASTNGTSRASSCNSQLSSTIQALQSINNRLTPFLDEYQRIVVDESQDINSRTAQNTFDQVSEVMHSLAHAYHALSDLICDFSQPSPRQIVCRPVLMRHSSFVQTGFPIQAQMINVSRAPRHEASRETSTNATSTNAATNTQTPSRADAATQRDNNLVPPRPEGTTAEAAANAAQSAAAAASAAAEQAASAARAAADAAASAITAALSSVGVDNGPGVSVRVHVDPLTPLIGSGVPSPQPSAPPASANATGNSNIGNANNGTLPRNSNNGRNWEILMDVGSGSINFNPIEAFGSPNGANNPDAAVVAGPFPWGSAPPPDFIQNLIQRLATEIGVNNNNNSTNNNNNNGNERRSEGETPQPRTREGTSQSTQSRSSASGATGNLPSLPSTSSRLHYLTVTPGSSESHGEFDPFLPCNSDHVRRARENMRETFLLPPRVSDNRDAWLPHGLGRISEYLPAYGREFEARTFPPEVQTQLQTRLGSTNITSQTVSELLQSISNSYRPGESIIMDVVMTAGRYVTIEDLLNPQRLSRSMINNMRPSLLRLLNEYFNMEIYSEAAVQAAIDKIDKELKPFFRRLLARGTGLGRHLHDNVDVEASISRAITHFVPIVIKDIIDGNDQRRSEGQVGRNGQGVTGGTQARSNTSSNNSNTASRPRSASTITLRAIQSISLGLPLSRLRPDQPVFDFANALVNLVFLCCKDISISQVVMAFAHCLSGYVDEFARRWFLSELGCWFVRLQSNHEREFCSYFCRRFVVFRTATNGSSESEDDQTVDMEIDEAIVTPSLSNPPTESPPEQPLPELVLESEWQQSVPPDWVPIITRDRREQRRAAAQGPLSDSYLSGMPSKRRKIVTSTKPHHTLTKAISESMSVALGAAGIAGSGLDGVAENAACDVDLRSAFKEQLRSSVESTLRSHPDFTPDKYPHAAKYFNLPPRHQ